MKKKSQAIKFYLGPKLSDVFYPLNKCSCDLNLETYHVAIQLFKKALFFPQSTYKFYLVKLRGDGEWFHLAKIFWVFLWSMPNSLSLKIGWIIISSSLPPKKKEKKFLNIFFQFLELYSTLQNCHNLRLVFFTRLKLFKFKKSSIKRVNDFSLQTSNRLCSVVTDEWMGVWGEQKLKSQFIKETTLLIIVHNIGGKKGNEWFILRWHLPV